jgi:hypothetical protein
MSSVRDELRGKIFAHRALKSEVVTIFGQEVEIRQPTMGQLLGARDEPDRRKAIVNLMIEYTYVPGTNERVFEDGDFESIISMPFGDDLAKVNQAINRLTSVVVADAKNGSAPTRANGTSSS